MFKTMLIGLMVLATASLTAAQTDDYKRWDFFAGYSALGVNNDLNEEDVIPDPEGFHGFNTSITRNVSRHLGLKFDFSGHFKSRPIRFGPVPNGIDVDSRRYNFVGGIQVKNNSAEKTFKPFVHALVGGVHLRNNVEIRNDLCVALFPAPCPADFTEKATGFSGIFGGGIDIHATDRIDVRIVQLDYNPTRLFGTTQHNLRFGIGIVFH